MFDTIGDADNLEINEFGFIYCLFSDGKRCTVLLLPEDNVEISYKNSTIHFDGNNAIGQNLLNHKDFYYEINRKLFEMQNDQTISQN